MADISNAAISSIKFDELASAPTTPSANDWKIYFKSGGAYVVDDAGVETGPLGAGGGGSVATDAIWDAAGDLAVGSGANTAARLAIGANATVLTSNGTTATWAAPTVYQALDAQLTDLAGLSYAGNALNVVRVNAGETAFELAAAAGGTPGGSDTYVQYNDSSAFGGSAGFTYNETNLTVGLGGGTVTADDPVLDLTQTWNNAAVTFNGIKLNITDTASAAASKYIVLQEGGVDRFWIQPNGTTGSGIETIWVGDTTTQQLRLYNTGAVFSLRSYASTTAREYIQFGGSGAITVAASNSQSVTLAGGATENLRLNFGGSTYLNSPADYTLEVGGLDGGTNGHTLRVYNTYTNSTNYERASLTWSSNVCYLKPENLGTGSARLFVPVTGSTTVGSLPAAATAGAGARSFVTDATATTFLSTVAGGGANAVPVVSDGTNWLIG
jgi:hypothetical protein